jgi:hypothetical protein
VPKTRIVSEFTAGWLDKVPSTAIACSALTRESVKHFAINTLLSIVLAATAIAVLMKYRMKQRRSRGCDKN